MRTADLLHVMPLVAMVACGAGLSAATSPSVAARPPTAAPPVRPGQPPALGLPGPEARSCNDDSACGAHRCNVAAGKCALPCSTDADCVAGTSCVHGAVAICLAARP